MAKFKRIFKTGVLGTIFGVILGVLFAKKSGQKTREELKRKFGPTKDKLVDAVKKTAEDAKGVKQEIEEGVKEIKDIFKEGEGK